MKSFVSSLSALAIALFLVGCGGTTDNDAAPSTVGPEGHAETTGGAHDEGAMAEGDAPAEDDAPAEGEAPAEGDAPAEGEKAAE